MSTSSLESNIHSAVGKGLSAVGKLSAALKPAPDAPHPYLTGIHQPMGEELTLTDLAVTGTIPDGLKGRYLRIGPNPVTAPNPNAYHWFVGDGMAHGIRIEGGKAQWYRNRWVRTTAVSEALGEPPAPGPRGVLEVVNTNIIGHAGRTFAIVEAGGFPVELTDGLETVAHNPFDGTLENAFSAHPHIDPATGEAHAVCYKAGVMDKVWHTVVDASGKVIREEPISVTHGPSIHDCQITCDHVILFDLPITFSMKAMLGGHSFPYRWNDKHKARVGLLGRTAPGDSIIWYDVDPCYVFHPANAFVDEAGQTVVDVVVHDRLFDAVTFGPDESRTAFERWTFDEASRRVIRAVIDSDGQEFPRYDERLTTQAYRYAYAVGVRNDRQDSLINDTTLIKHDLQSGQKQVRNFGANRHPGEFVFVPRHEDAAEDEGWLIGLVVDMNDDTTDLIILNADDMLGDPQAIIHLPHRVPPGFHGNWVADR